MGYYLIFSFNAILIDLGYLPISFPIINIIYRENCIEASNETLFLSSLVLYILLQTFLIFVIFGICLNLYLENNVTRFSRAANYKLIICVAFCWITYFCAEVSLFVFGPPL